MLLSEAMRFGSMMRPQVKYVLFGMTPDGRLGSCALGAAYEAAGASIADLDFSPVYNIKARLPREWHPFYLVRPTACPVCLLTQYSVIHVIAHLNDDHDWTREQIADWVEGIEDTLVSPISTQEPARQTEVEELSELVCA